MSDHGDPRLTAYALGECDDAERAAVEAMIAADPAARDEVEAIRAAAGMLEVALAGAPLPSLEPARRAALVGKEAGTPEPVPAPVLLPGGKPRRARPLVGAAAAATLLGIAFGVAGYSVAVDRGMVRARRDVAFDSNFGMGIRARLPASPPSSAAAGAPGASGPVSTPSKGREATLDESATVTITGSLPAKVAGLKDGTSAGALRATGGRGDNGEAGNRTSSLPLAEGGAGTGGDGGRGGDSYKGTAPPTAPSGSPPHGFGGGGGGGGHQYVGPAGEVPGGGGGSGEPARVLTTSTFHNANADGDYRGRTERIFDRSLGATLIADKPTLGYLFTDDKPVELPGFDRFVVGGGIGEQVIYLPKDGVVVDEAAVRVALGKAAVKPVPVVVRPAGNGFVIDLPNNRFGEEHPRESTTESSTPIVENPWIRPVGEAALSTFSVDVDTAGYTIVRRCLTRQNRLPEPASVRIEELVNYFPWDYEPPSGAEPFAVHAEAAACPWEPRHRLVRVALKGRMVDNAVRPPANFVFLLDVSGSMNQPNKLPLVKESIKLLAGRLDARDRVSIVVYAGASGLVLPPTPGNDTDTIFAAIGRLNAGGSTNGGAGIELAYKVAQENFVPGGINRVILATDGDFNVGVTNRASLTSLIEEKAKTKVFLTALGYGMDNLKDDTLEVLADKGNGNYGYVDDLAEARRLLVDQGMSTLHTIAKDVKIQVEFNPAKVSGYRLLGYENRVMAAQDFADDRKDAGEIGAGHAVTAFYEVVPAGEAVPGAAVDELRYQRPGAGNGSPETLTVKLRWKEPEGDESALREVPFTDAGGGFDAATEDFRFAAAVVEWGLLLRGSRNAAGASFSAVQEIASGACSRDEGGWKAEFLRLVALSAGMRR